MFTEQFGLRSYIVNGVRSAKAKNKIALFQPLTLLDLVVYEKPQANINRISEIRCQEPFRQIPVQIKKSSIALFLAEILSKILKEETENPDLFQFIYHSIISLDQQTSGYENFHLQFLLKVSRFLGFAPSSGAEMLNQIYAENNKYYLLETGEEKNLMELLWQNQYHATVQFNNSTRRHLLELILKYFEIHLENLGEIKSLAVLKEVMQ